MNNSDGFGQNKTSLLTKIGLWFRLLIGMMILDAWIFQNVKRALERKGPLITFRTQSPPRHRAKGRKKRTKGIEPMKKIHIAGFGLAALAVIAGVAILAVAAFRRWAPAPVQAVVEGTTPAPGA